MDTLEAVNKEKKGLNWYMQIEALQMETMKRSFKCWNIEQ